MKKLLSIVAVAALFSTGAIAENTITIGGSILPSAVVGFDPVNGETLGTDKFIDTDIQLGSHEVNAFNSGALDASNRSIFVKTNIASTGSVTMSINSGNANKNVLLDASGATIPVVYKIGATTLNPDASNTATIATEANAGSTAITDKFTITPNAAPDQLAGNYGATLTVTISAS